MNRFLRVGERYALSKRKPKYLNIRYISLLAVLTSMCLYARAQRPEPSGPVLSGIVTNTSGIAIAGATISIKGSAIRNVTDDQGRFRLRAPKPTGILRVSYLGHEAIEEKFDIKNGAEFHFALLPLETILEEVQVNTGYQTMPKEQVTGSFEVLGAKDLQRNPSANILDKLDGVTNGLMLDRNQTGTNQSFATIRGRTTIYADPNPLVILDNFPYEGDLNAIDVMNIHSVTVLKDAAAASIWGTRAGNGVIVITTKNGTRGAQPKVEFESIFRTADKPDLFYQPRMTVTEYLDRERFLFERGYYNWPIADGYSGITEGISLLDKHARGELTDMGLEAGFSDLIARDVDKQVFSHFYRRSMEQQYHLRLSGGGEKHTYNISSGYNNAHHTLRPNRNNRYSLNLRNGLQLFQDKLNIQLSYSLVLSEARTKSDSYTPVSPYETLVDEQGRGLPVFHDYRKSFIDTVGGGNLLDWTYVPLNEIRTPRTASSNQQIINLSLDYQLVDGLNATVIYQSYGENTGTRLEKSLEYYDVRDYINRFTHIDATSGEMTRPVPLGSIVDNSSGTATGRYARAGLSYEGDLSKSVDISVLAGYELRSTDRENRAYRIYGYDASTGSDANSLMDYRTFYPLLHDPYSTARISDNTASGFGHDRNLSYFITTGITYKDMISLSGSARNDKSNLFGVKSNQKGVPLWSAGLRIDIGRLFPETIGNKNRLAFKASLGRTGNVDKSTSAYLTTIVGEGGAGLNQWNTPFTQVLNPPNPSLRWEQVHKANLGVEFEVMNGRLTGVLEVYGNRGIDLIGNSPIAPQTGISLFKGNSASTRSEGIELSVRYSTVGNRWFGWSLNTFFNYNKQLVTEYLAFQGDNQDVVRGNYANPLVGYPYNSVFSFPSAGLDAAGDPQGYIGGITSKDYAVILNSTNPDELRFHGSGTPQFYAGAINSLRLMDFTVSFNIIWKAGYHFRTPSVFDGSSYFGYRLRGYSSRWQEAGDEERTYVPSMVYPANGQRSGFFAYSEHLINRGDHIRLKDISINYHAERRLAGKIGLGSLSAYFYMDNVGMIWKSNKLEIDPDYVNGIPTPRSFTFGIKGGF